MNLGRILSAGCLAAAAVVVLSLAGAAGAANADKSKSTVSIVRAVVSGPLAGGGGEFSMLLEGFAFKSSDGRGVAVAADAFFGSVECATLETDADVKFSGLTRAIVAGTVTGECFDFDSETVSPYRADFEVVWRGLGRTTKERSEEEACVLKTTSRDSSADGSFTWSAPALGLSGSATSIVATEMFELRDRCRRS
jgi:hypothetical protein